MKRVCFVLSILLIVLCLCSCLSTFGESKEETTKKTEVQQDSRNTYSSYCYSSNYTREILTRDDAILILADVNDYRWVRSIESALKLQFVNEGISIKVLSDYKKLDTFTSAEEVAKYLLQQPFLSEGEKKSDYILDVTVPHYSSYLLGGGIKDVEFSVDVYALKDGTQIETILVDVMGEKNNYESYNSSLETVVSLLATEVVKEYCKYLAETPNQAE